MVAIKTKALFVIFADGILQNIYVQNTYTYKYIIHIYNGEIYICMYNMENVL